MSGKATAAPVRERSYSPSEFSAALAEHGIDMHPVTIRERCNLAADHPDHIATNPLFKGRHYIPDSELFRICGIRVGVSE